MKKFVAALSIVIGSFIPSSAQPIQVSAGLTNCVAGGRTASTYVEANGYCRDNCSYCSNKKVSMTYFVPRLNRNVTTTGNCVDGPYESSVVRVYNSVMSGSQRFVSATMVSC